MSRLHQDAPHESAHLHVTGEAVYVADLPGPAGTLHAALVPSPVARGRLLGVDPSALPEGTPFFTAADVPGHLHIGPSVQDEPLLARDELIYLGQPVAMVLGATPAEALALARSVKVQVEELPPILGIEAAIEADSWLTEPHRIARGDVEAAFASAVHLVEGRIESPAQDHFYLETHAALVLPEEDGCLRVLSSTQHPSEVQAEVAAVLGLASHRVGCEVPRLGGGFGGKESQASLFACLAALGTFHTGRAVKLVLDRDEDMANTGKRHPFRLDYRFGFDADGGILGAQVQLFSDGGATADLSGPVMDRALFHVDNTCYLPAVDLVGRVCRTNRPSNTAFRGFGGPQGMLALEEALDRLAERLELDPAELRRKNLYREGQPAPFGQAITNNRLPRLLDELLESSDYAARRERIAAFNAGSPYLKRGLGLQLVKFGISFTMSLLNQAGALVQIYRDGSVQLNHGGTEMGQGLHTKMRAVAAEALGVETSAVRVMRTHTGKVPNTSATAASSGTDLNGAAVRAACQTLNERLDPVRAELGPQATLAELASAAWARQISLSATGFYATPGIAYDHTTGQGTPFFYFAFGGGVFEVELNGLTGEHRLVRADILHDVGDGLVPSIDLGQVEGAFVQGMGWMTGEEVLLDQAGRCLTHGPSTYKIPSVGDIPLDLRVALLQDAPQPGVVGGSKAVGEPPFVLGMGLIRALRQAVGAFGPGEVELSLPATGEALLRAVSRQRRA
jgi:xanthine dehydrogenase large subunit